MEGSSDDFEEVKVPLWIEEMFGVETITGSKLAQMYTTFMGLHQFQQRSILCDVNINVENTVFHAHKAVLGASSRFFRSMFTSGFQESRESDVSVAGKPEAFKVILDYIYTCELTLTIDTVVDVLEISHYLQLDLVMKRSEQYLIDELKKDLPFDSKMVITSLATAKVYGFEVLIEAAKKCIAKNFIPTDSFLDLMTMELLEEILGRNDLKDEKQVYDTILAWLQHDWDERKNFAPALFRKIRLGIVPVGHLSKTFLKYPDLYAIKECGELIDKTLDMVDAKTEDAPLYFTEPDLFATRTMINAILGFDTKCGYYYDTDTKRWITLTNFPPLPAKDSNLYPNGDSCVSTNGHLYVSRGTASYPRKLKYPQFLRLDVPSNQWVPLQPMNKRRHTAYLVAGSRKIYAIGGDIESSNFTGEVYSIDSNTWESLPSLNFDNGSAFCKPTIESCKVYQDKLLVYGRRTMYGVEWQTSQHHYLKTYDPANSREWTTLKEGVTHGSPPTAVTGLVINDDKCYRVLGCACYNHAFDECPKKKAMNVHEIVIDFEAKTSRITNKQEQDLITGTNVLASEKMKAFRVNEDVYVIHNQQFFKTGIKIPRNRTDPVKLGSWKNLKQLPPRQQLLPPQSLLLAQFMFDKQKWL